MKLPILYSFRRCPYAMRARMALVIANIECELREVVLRSKPPSMLEASPKGTVPILLLPDGRVLDESMDIIDWTMERSNIRRWSWPLQDPTTRAPAYGLITENDGPFKFALDRYKYADRYPEQDATLYRGLTEPFLDKLELRLTHSPYLFGDDPSLVDVAIFPFVRQFARVDLDWFESTDYNGLQRWLKALEEGQLFRSIMRKHDAWRSGDSVTYFLEDAAAQEAV
ncbi:glutathione S-transferase [Denitrobaculum tricleocarpae]|uniref:Glutathione S-transferase n=1 Tax=Denitrobaculum tricleocarpae TaxID=2591009 RepID=A0A545TMA6_9PROT|nr:glutathione S-transferase [Denitrobaculum tricleocarpae]TQV78377.1 glutathione S-transferase [Denitrobaculum tricleocarpae]